MHGGIAKLWWGKCSRYSRRMHNPQFSVSGKSAMLYINNIWLAVNNNVFGHKRRGSPIISQLMQLRVKIIGESPHEWPKTRYSWQAIYSQVPLSSFYFWHDLTGAKHRNIWVGSWRCACLVTWFCYHLIAKTGNETGATSWPDPYENSHQLITMPFLFMMGQSIVVLWHHTNTYCDVIMTNCSQNVSKWVTCHPTLVKLITH